MSETGLTDGATDKYAEYDGLKLGIDLVNAVSNELTQYGSETLFRELVQNADDAGATRMWIHLDGPSGQLPAAILVSNDSFFSADERHNDVRRFMMLHSKGKARERESIGRFGIGRVACYHVTDCPIVLSHLNDEKWILLALQLEGDPVTRTLQSRKNAQPRIPSAILDEIDPGVWKTTYYLKTRLEATSLSNELEVLPVTQGDWERLHTHLNATSLIGQLLFIRNVRQIEVTDRDGPVLSVSASRLPCSDVTSSAVEEAAILTFEVVGARSEVLRFLVVSAGSEFDCEAGTQTQVHKRGSVSMAFQLEDKRPKALPGRLFCFLPTAIETGLPFHLHAPFQVRMDREGFVPDTEARQWNQSLLRRLGLLFQDTVPIIRELAQQSGDPLSFYEVYPTGANLVHANNLEDFLGPCWDKDVLSATEVVLDSQGCFQLGTAVHLVRPDLQDLFCDSSVRMAHRGLHSGQAGKWLSLYESTVGPLRPFGIEEAVRWLDQRIDAGDQLADIQSSQDPETAGSVLKSRERWLQLLQRISGANKLSCLADMKLGLAVDGCFYPFDGDLFTASPQLRNWVAGFEKHLPKLSDSASLPAYLVHGEAQKCIPAITTICPPIPRARYMELLGEYLGPHNRDRVAQAFEAVTSQPRVRAFAEHLKFLALLEADPITPQQAAGLLICADRDENPIACPSDGPLAYLPEGDAGVYFLSASAPLVSGALVGACQGILRQLGFIEEWNPEHLAQVAAGAWPALGDRLSESSEPPFKTPANLRRFLNLISDRWPRERDFLKSNPWFQELPLLLTAEGRLCSIQGQAGTKPYLPPDSTLPPTLEQSIPAETVVHDELAGDTATRAFLQRRLGLQPLDEWGYFESAVLPSLDPSTHEKSVFVVVLDWLRGLADDSCWKDPHKVGLIRDANYLLVRDGQDEQMCWSPAASEFDTPLNLKILADRICRVHECYGIDDGTPQAALRRTFLELAGVVDRPRADDIVSAVEDIASRSAPLVEVQSRVDAILECLADLDAKQKQEYLNKSRLEVLKNTPWLTTTEPGSREKHSTRLRKPIETYWPNAAMLAWSTAPILATKSKLAGSHSIYRAVGMLCALPPNVTLPHLKNLVERLTQEATEEDFIDYKGVLRWLDGINHDSWSTHLQALKTFSVFPIAVYPKIKVEGSVNLSFGSALSLLPPDEAQHFQHYAEYYPEDFPGLKVARFIGLPEQAGPQHVSRILRNLSDRWPRLDKKAQAKGAKVHHTGWARIRDYLAKGAGREAVSDLQTFTSVLCTDGQFRTTQSVIVLDNESACDLVRDNLPPSMGFVENLSHSEKLWRVLDIPRLSSGLEHTLVDGGGSRDRDIQGATWLSPPRVRALRRVWYKHASEKGQPEGTPPDMKSWRLKRVRELKTKVTVKRPSGTELLSFVNIDSRSAFERKPGAATTFLVHQDLTDEEASRELSVRIAEVLVTGLSVRPSVLAPTIYIILSTADSGVLRALDSFSIPDLPPSFGEEDSGSPPPAQAASGSLEDAAPAADSAPPPPLRPEEGATTTSVPVVPGSATPGAPASHSPVRLPGKPGGPVPPTVIPGTGGVAGPVGASPEVTGSTLGTGSGRELARRPSGQAPDASGGGLTPRAGTPVPRSSDRPAVPVHVITSKPVRAAIACDPGADEILRRLVPARSKQARDASPEEKDAFGRLLEALQREGLADFARTPDEIATLTVAPRRPAITRSVSSSPPRVVHVSAHYRSLPGSLSPSPTLDAFWNSRYEAALPKVLDEETYLVNVQRALMDGEFLSEDQALEHLNSVRVVLDLNKGPNGASMAVDSFLRRLQEQSAPRELAILSDRVGLRAMILLKERCEDPDRLSDVALSSLLWMATNGRPLNLERWLDLLPRPRHSIALLLWGVADKFEGRRVLEMIALRGRADDYAFRVLKQVASLDSAVAAAILEECVLQYRRRRLSASELDGAVTQLCAKCPPAPPDEISKMDLALLASLCHLHGKLRGELHRLDRSFANKKATSDEAFGRLLWWTWFLKKHDLPRQGIKTSIRSSLEQNWEFPEEEIIMWALEGARDAALALLPCRLPQEADVLASIRG